MVIPQQRPLLFLDVDGVLIPFGPSSATSDDRTALEVETLGANPLISRVRVSAGRALASLPYDLVWATAWGQEANESLTDLLGLPSLPVVDWPDESPDEDRDVVAGRHWKTRPLVAWAAGRPFAWVDDEITDRDREWVSNCHPGPALLHRVDAAKGLTDHDVDVLAGWTTTLGNL